MITDLDTLSLPNYSVFPLQAHKNMFVVISENSSSWFITNSTGLDLLKNFDGLRRKEDTTLRNLSAAYHIERDNILNDFSSLVDSIKKVGFFQNERLEDYSSLNVEIKHMYLELTNNCNLQCLHCYLGDRQEGIQELSLEKVKEIITIFEEREGKYITVSGGEIFLYTNWEAVLRFLSKTSIETAVFTNGTLLNEYIIDKLILYNIQNIGLSIHGSRESDCKIRGKEAHDKSIDSLQLLKKKGLIQKVCLSITPVKINKEDLENYCKFALEMGISRINISLFEPRGNGLTNYDLLCLSQEEKNQLIETIYSLAMKYRTSLEIDFTDIRNILTKFTANSLEKEKHPFWQGIHVTANGNVFLSVLCYIPQYLIGNIYREPFSTLLTSKRLKDFMLEVVNRKQTIEECSECTWKYFCGGGNPASTFFQYHTIHRQTPYCRAFKSLFPKLIEQIAVFQA